MERARKKKKKGFVQATKHWIDYMNILHLETWYSLGYNNLGLKVFV
jgi:hypothetical protein